MKHPIDPAAPIMSQLRGMGIPEHLPIKQTMLYRFYDEAGRLLYVGVTVSPCNRWQKHKRRSVWWSDAKAVRVEWHPHQRAALDAEDAAIKAEAPAFNIRSVPARLMHDSCTAHESGRRDSGFILPRVGGGVGVRVGFGKQVKFSTHPQSPPAARGDASAAPRPEVTR